MNPVSMYSNLGLLFTQDAKADIVIIKTPEAKGGQLKNVSS